MQEEDIGYDSRLLCCSAFSVLQCVTVCCSVRGVEEEYTGYGS